VLGDADRVAIGDLRHRYAAVHRRLKIDMIRADACGQREFELLLVLLDGSKP
jgi:hypothetical protein